MKEGKGGLCLKAAFVSAGGSVGVGTRPPFVTPKHTPSGIIMPDRSTFVFLLVVLHLGVLCYWCYLMYLSNRYPSAGFHFFTW